MTRSLRIASSSAHGERRLICKGLRYAGTEGAGYGAFDDGDQWKPLQLNMPTGSICDLVIHVDDLAAATDDRTFWILDDSTRLCRIDRTVASAQSPCSIRTSVWTAGR